MYFAAVGVLQRPDWPGQHRLVRAILFRAELYLGEILTPTYHCWYDMMRRCTYPKHQAYRNYGGRGIHCDQQWLKFANFIADMGERPTDMTLDRINNNGPYCKENCRWVTMKVQQNNRRNNHALEVSGLILNIKQWAEKTGINEQTIHERLRIGWSEHDAVTKPVRAHNSRQTFDEQREMR